MSSSLEQFEIEPKRCWKCLLVEKQRLLKPPSLENPLPIGRAAMSTAKSSSPLQEICYFLSGEGKGEVCAVVRINPAHAAQARLGLGCAWCGASQSCLGLPSPPAPQNPLSPQQCGFRMDDPNLRNALFSGIEGAYSQAMLHLHPSTHRQGRAGQGCSHFVGDFNQICQV